MNGKLNKGIIQYIIRCVIRCGEEKKKEDIILIQNVGLKHKTTITPSHITHTQQSNIHILKIHFDLIVKRRSKRGERDIIKL